MAPKAKGEKTANKGATDRAASPAPAVATEDAAPAGPPPSWKVHLARLAVPDGFDPGLLFSAAAEGRPCISLIEPLTILKESKDADIVAELKSLPAGEPPPADLIMKVLINKFAEDKAVGIERKTRPAEEGTEENIASRTPHEGEPADELIKEEPPPPDESADVYYLLKDFPRGPADGPAMSAAGFELDTLVTLKMDSKGLRLAAAAALEAAAAAAPAKGKGKAAEAAKVVDPAQAEQGSTEEPLELPTDALTEALVPVLGKVGAGFQETLAVALSMPAAEGWAKPAMIFSKLASLLYAVAQKKHMYNNFKLTLTVQDVPRVACPVDMTHYRRLLSALPIHTVSVAYILHCMVEQVVLSTLTSDEQSTLASEQSLQAIESMLCAAVEEEGKLPLTGPRRASESAAVSSQDTLLVPFWDVITARELTPPPLGLPQPNKDELALQATTERNMHDALPVPAKHRRGMPAEASLTAEERGIERTELHHFSRFSSTQIDASMCLRGLARLINGADPHRGSRGHGWLLASRPWAEELSRTQMAQRMLELRATSRRSTRLHAYHARDDVLLYALHDSVPPEREGVDAWRCELFDLVSRKFGAWHAWLMRSGPDEDVPSAPLPPFGGVLYNLDERVADLLLTTTSLYPCDHHILRYTMCGTYSMCTIEPRSGGYARMLRGIGMPPKPADFSVTFSDGGRAQLTMADDGEWSVWIGGVDGLQVALQCSGTVHMLQPHVETSTDNTVSDAATLILSGLVLSGAPSNEAEKLHLKAILLDVEPPEVTALSPAVHMRSEVESYNFDALKISLPLGSPRPPFLRFELWDKDPDIDPDASPFASAESRLSNIASGGFDLVLSSPGREGADISLSGTFELERLDDVPKPEPTPAEVSRTILPTGVVIVHFEDGSKRVMYRNGNTADRKATGPHADSWVTTNLRGLRMGTTNTGESFYVAPVAVASSSDPVSHNVVTTRADGTLVLSRADGSRLVQFADGTTINSSPEAVKNAQRGSLSVRCDGYAPVDINLRLGEVTMFGLDGTDAKVHDASISVHHRSGLQFTLSKEGKVSYFPAQLAWMPGRAHDESTGVYKLDLVASTLETKDPQGSVFRVSFDQGHSVDLVLPDELSTAETPVAEDEDPDWSHPPKLFICRADGTGVELLRTADVAPFIEARDVDADKGICMHLREPVSGDTTAEVHTWVWRDWLQHTVTKLAAERDRSDAQLLLAYLPKVKYVPPTTTLLHFRRLLKREPLTAAQREHLEKELLEMEQYRVHEEKRAQELHIKDARSEGEGESERDLQQELLQTKGAPTHISRDIDTEVSNGMAHMSRAYRLSQAASGRENSMERDMDRSIQRLTLKATINAVDELQPQKASDAPSKNGKYMERRPKPLQVGGDLRFFDSTTKTQLDPWPQDKHYNPDLNTEPSPTGSNADAQVNAAPAASRMSTVAETQREKPRPAPKVFKAIPTASPAEMTLALPLPANRMSVRIPPKLDGGVRPSKVSAPVVSNQPAPSNPNISNLLLEGPFKRNVHTMSVNQRYMHRGPTLNPAFELTPAVASFGCLKVGSVARLKLKLSNVSNLPQRFVIKGPCGGSGSVSIVYTPGVAAPGISIPFEIEICSQLAAEVREVVTVITEREEITLPVDAIILDEEAFVERMAAHGEYAKALLKLPRIISAEPRDPSLGKTVPRRVDETTVGTKRFSAPGRDTCYTRPDFFAEPPSGDEMEESP